MLKPEEQNLVPEDTQRVARAVFPKGNPYLIMRTELGVIYEDKAFIGLFPTHGQPAESPGVLAMVTALQFAEGLSDRQAAEAVRSRIDWKYLLGLELTDPGFDYSVLSEFRGRVIRHGVEEDLLNHLLDRFKAKGLLKERSQQRTDSTHVEANIRVLNSLEKVGETLRHALNELAEVAPEWLRARVPDEWYTFYEKRIENYRLPSKEKERDALMLRIGRDGFQLLNWVIAPDTPSELKALKAVEILRQVWLQEYYQDGDDLHWRSPGNRPSEDQQIVSPYDPEARFSQKRNTQWCGYKAHLTEVCEEGHPHLITQVETTPATTPDNQTTPTIQAALAKQDVLPDEHLLDAGYMDAHQVVASQEKYGVTMIGPVLSDRSWQAKQQKGFDLSHFIINWQTKVVTCPMGHLSHEWFTDKDASGKPRIGVRFAFQDCQACPVRQDCTHSQSKVQGRNLRFRPEAEHLVLQRFRRWVKTDEFKQKYRKRAGIEGTFSQAVRTMDLRSSRYIGLAKTHLQHILTAIAINLARFTDWFAGSHPEQTRTSRFAALKPSLV